MGELAKLASMPSEYQRGIWWEFIAITDGPVQDGNCNFTWIGWCPLCDKDKDEEHFTARFDFRRGLLWCDREDGEGNRKPCYERRTMSLTNVLIEMTRDNGQR